MRINNYLMLLSVYSVISFFCYTNVFAEKADVLYIEIKNEGNTRYSFTVTIQHNDSGWDHYADRWEILTLDEKILAARILRHPHLHEQPVTRSLDFIPIPEITESIIVRAHCSRDGYGGKQVSVTLLEENSN
jgi:hypothetical protein